MIPPDEKQIMELVDAVRNRTASRILQIPETTLIDLAAKALERQPTARLALKTMRRKLHQISAPYLGDPDYTQATCDLKLAFKSDDPEGVQNCCREIMTCHASTRERLLVLDNFYTGLFEKFGKPSILFDLACGLNPLSWRWMGLPSTTVYHAFDIHAPRVSFLNEYFRLEQINGEVSMRDILVHPPTEKADCAFLFKEAHRFEEREPGCNRKLWKALKVKILYVSLPPVNLTGRHDLTVKNRRLVKDNIAGEAWRVSEISFINEQVFVIEK